MDTLIKVAQFFLSLSLLIVLHEWGHYFFARLFKTRVNKFYLFFDFLFPVPTLLNFSLWKKKKGDTEFGIGWFPFGGYVQIDGMMDETQDADKLKAPPQPWEFRSKPAWQRLFIMMGGIIVNVLTAFIIYGMILFVWGETKVVNSSVKNGIAVGDTLMYSIGFRDGDKIKSVDGETIQYFDDVLKKVIIKGEEAKVTVDRNGKDELVIVPKDILGKLSTKKIDKKGLIGMRMPNIVDSMPEKAMAQSNAFKAGILPNDKVIRLDSTSINYWQDIASYTEKQKDSAEILVTVLRGDKELLIKVKLDANKKLGLAPISFQKMEKAGWLATETRKYGFFESIPAGVKKTVDKLGDYIDQFALLFKPSTGAYKGMGGFASMTQIFGTHWDWESFWSITAFFSVVLAFMNFLPIPMLDGGYILFTLFEMITGKKVPDSFLEKANMVGFIIIIGLMVFTNGNDIFRKVMGWF
ncbi:MAG TPA: RIP metalloprotease RseP [Ferruginibacter sp.]|nr:RIP metalloprotease RseP [Ferruginibacter sp.]HPH90996.1 RIP metalloprotease RseP [Ferruginibacter sp.]